MDLRAFLLGTLILLPFGTACRPSSPGRVLASGVLEMREVYLSPTVPGKLSTLAVQEGDSVKAGQRVGTLDRFDDARRDLARARVLLSQNEFSRQQAEKVELALQDQQLVSPINGVILNRVSEPGEALSPGVPAVVIGNPQDVYIKVYVSDRDIGRVTLGRDARIQVDAFPDRSFEGRVTFISPKAEFTPKNIQTREERVTQMFAVKISVLHPDGALKPGMPADCEIDVRNGH